LGVRCGSEAPALRFKKPLLIGGAIALTLVVAGIGALYAMLRFGVLPLRDGAGLGDSVTTVVAGHVGPIAIGSYIVKLTDGGVALIDAGIDPNGVAIRNALVRMGKTPGDVKAILFTHGHNDHIAGAVAFPSAATYVLEPDVPLVERWRGPDDRRIAVTRGLHDGERLDISGTTVEVFGVPGHTAGSAAFLVRTVLFVGDSAASLRDGSMRPNTMLSDDAARTVQSMLALSKHLSARRNEIHYIAFGHQGPVDGLDPLITWAATQSR
jgi:glyoxylase-like metal-dependent hydrolase (beta-lactamase superfamily II)